MGGPQGSAPIYNNIFSCNEILLGEEKNSISDIPGLAHSAILTQVGHVTVGLTVTAMAPGETQLTQILYCPTSKVNARAMLIIAAFAAA